MFCRKMCTVQNLQKQNSAIARRVCRANVCRIILRILCRICARRFVCGENFLRRVGGKSFLRGIFCVAVVFLCAEGNFSGGRGVRGGVWGGWGFSGGQNGQKRAKKGPFWGGPGGGTQNGQFLSPSGTRVVWRVFLRPIAQGGKCRHNMP